jgi:hypothetical protein
VIFLAETLLVALAAYRLWRLVGQDDITEPFRFWLERLPWVWPLHLVTCGWCAGTWTALGVAFGASALGWIHSPPLLLGLAAAVGVGFLSERLV